MKHYKLAIFDLDGTLLDTLNDLANSTNYALTQMGFPQRSLTEIRGFVGNGVAKLIERAVPKNTSAVNIEKTLSLFKAHYAEHCEDETKPYDGIMMLLDTLLKNNILIAVVSNKLDSAVSVLCKKYFGEHISVSAGDKEDRRKKPAPDAIFEVLNTLNILKEDAVYIGDSEVDIETAKNAHMDCVSVTWGFRDTNTLLNAWGFDSSAITTDRLKHGVPYEDGIAYFASSVPEIEKILINTNK